VWPTAHVEIREASLGWRLNKVRAKWFEVAHLATTGVPGSFSMEDHRFDAFVFGIVEGAGAGVMGHESPALWGFVKDVGSDDKGFVRTGGGHDFDAFNQMMYSAGQGFDFVDALRIGLYVAVGKHGLKASTDGTGPDQARTTGVDAQDVFFVRPAGHELVDVCRMQGFVKSVLNFVGTAAHDGGLKFGFGHAGNVLCRLTSIVPPSFDRQKNTQPRLGIWVACMSHIAAALTRL
jgi:hypothetical protein